MTTLNEIADDIAEIEQLASVRARRIAAKVFDEIAARIAAGEVVSVRGFGSFRAPRLPARVGRNPQTGEKMYIGSKLRPRCVFSTTLAQRLNLPARQRRTA